MAPTLFISDLHLDAERSDKIALFRRLLRGPARQAAALYILGDLFEHFWLGNDDPTPPVADIVMELREISGCGVATYVVRGNRDLMLGPEFEALSGCRVLPDRTVIDLAGNSALITHGDTLCTRDTAYQIYRRLLEWSPVRQLFRKLPLTARLRLCRGLRPWLRRAAAGKPREIVDADPAAVVATLRRYQVREMIHGHTHRPAIHDLHIDGAPARRIVLGDWYEDARILVCAGEQRTLIRAADYIDAATG